MRGRVRLQKVGQGGAEIALFVVEHHEPVSLVGASVVTCRSLGQSQEPLTMQLSERVHIFRPKLVELPGGIVADRFREPVAHTGSIGIGLNEALVDERRKQLEYFEIGKLVSCADGLCCLERPPAREDGEAAQQVAFRRAEQVV